VREVRHGFTLINTVIFYYRGGREGRREEEAIRESDYQGAGYQENRVSGKGGCGEIWR
jgi:hypothetical protein